MLEAVFALRQSGELPPVIRTGRGLVIARLMGSKPRIGDKARAGDLYYLKIPTQSLPPASDPNASLAGEALCITVTDSIWTGISNYTDLIGNNATVTYPATGTTSPALFRARTRLQ